MLRVGIDLGGTKTEGVLLARDGSPSIRRRIPTRAGAGYEAILEDLVGLAGRLLEAADDAATLGIGIPGCLDQGTGRVKNSNTQALQGRTLQRDLEARLARPVAVANDANCFAIAEARAGAARGHEVVFGIILGTGVGGGLVIGGIARQGLHGIAGEWGHSPLEDRDEAAPPAPLCYCGQRGCVETRLSGPALERDYERLAGVRLSASDVFARAAAGDGPAARAVARYLAFFGEGLARLIHILDPDAIVLGGGLANADILYERGPAAIERVLFHDRLGTPILRPGLGDSAGVFGAAWLPPSARPESGPTDPRR